MHDMTVAAKGNGFISINKFWAFENYNYFIFSTKGNGEEQVVCFPKNSALIG